MLARYRRVFSYLCILSIFSCFNSLNINNAERSREAIITGNIEDVRKYVNKSNVNIKDSRENTPLAYWVTGREHSKDILIFLLKTGAEIALTSVMGENLADFLLNDLGMFNIVLDVASNFERELIKKIFGRKYTTRYGEVYLLDKAKSLLEEKKLAEVEDTEAGEKETEENTRSSFDGIESNIRRIQLILEKDE